jgi:DNA repair exonuclease SbcCD ATPase subunit
MQNFQNTIRFLRAEIRKRQDEPKVDKGSGSKGGVDVEKLGELLEYLEKDAVAKAETLLVGDNSDLPGLEMPAGFHDVYELEKRAYEQSNSIVAQSVRIDELNTRVVDMASLIPDLSRQVAKVYSEKDEQVQKVATLETRVGILEGTLKERDKRIDTQGEQIVRLSEGNAVLRGEIESIREENVGLKKRIKELEKRLEEQGKEFSKRLDEKDTLIKTQGDLIRTQGERIAKLEAENVNLKAELKAQADKFDERLKAELKAQADKFDERLKAELKAQADKFDERLKAELKAQADKFDIERDAVKAEITGLKAELKAQADKFDERLKAELKAQNARMMFMFGTAAAIFAVVCIIRSPAFMAEVSKFASTVLSSFAGASKGNVAAVASSQAAVALATAAASPAPAQRWLPMLLR